MKILEFLEVPIVEIKKQNPAVLFNKKQSIILLIQALIEIMGKIIEPYVNRIITILMRFFGDQNETIRLTSLKLTKIIMSFLSAYGLKNMLPLLLKGI